MSIHFKTNDPNRLLLSFKKAIDEGKIITWKYDDDGDFTHTTEQWAKLAWLRPKIINSDLVFVLIKPKDKNISSLVYAIYHGRFIESMLVHCDELFQDAVASALPADGEKVS